MGLGELQGFLGAYLPLVSQVGLVPDEHDDAVGLGVFVELLQPSADVLEAGMFGNVVDEESAYSSSVVSRGDGSVSFLSDTKTHV